MSATAAHLPHSSPLALPLPRPGHVKPAIIMTAGYKAPPHPGKAQFC